MTATGWFDDDKCTAGRVKNGQMGPSNQDCARKCIKEGAKVVFLDEKRKASFVVDNPEATRGIESDYVEFTGTTERRGGHGARGLDQGEIEIRRQLRQAKGEGRKNRLKSPRSPPGLKTAAVRS